MIDVRVAEASEKDAVLNTLMLAFSSDPCLRFILDTPDKFFKAFRPFATGMGGAGVERGTAWLADDGAAAALWLPPGVESDRDAMLGVLMDLVDPAKLPTVAEVGETMAQYHPEAPHWYLAMIGVDPARQGRGYGSAILKESVRRCDEEGVIAYLESSNPKNVPLYERYGFEVMGHVAPGDFPGLYPMIRQPRGVGAVIKRALWAVALGLGVLIVSLFTWDAVTRQITSNRLRERTAYWTAAVGSGVRVGETREEAERWLRKTFRTQPSNRDFYDEYNHSLVVPAETIEVVGVTFPCAAWMILVDVKLGADGRVTSRTVKTSGACV